MTRLASLRALAASRLQQENVLIFGATTDLPQLVRTVVGPNKLVVAVNMSTDEHVVALDDPIRDKVIVIVTPPTLIDPAIFHAHGVPDPLFDLVIYQEHLPSIMPMSVRRVLHYMKQYLAPNGRFVLPMIPAGPIHRSNVFLELNHAYAESANLENVRLVALNGFPFVPISTEHHRYEPEAYYEAADGLRFSINALQQASIAANSEDNESTLLDFAAYGLRDAAAVWRTKLQYYRQTPPVRMPFQRWIKIGSPIARILRKSKRRYGTFMYEPDPTTMSRIRTGFAATSNPVSAPVTVVQAEALAAT